jgi:putative endopeptidase
MAKTTHQNSWGFNTSHIDPSIRPQDDFYQYAGGAWLKQAVIPKNESWWGAFVQVRTETDKQILSLMQELDAKRSVVPGSAEQMIRDFYRSGMDEKRRAALGTSPLDGLRKKIRAMKSSRDVQAMLAQLHRLGVGVLWGAALDQDLKNADRWQIQLHQAGIGMPDRDYYLLDGVEQKRVRDAYVPHIQKMLKLAGYTAVEAVAASKLILAIETRLAHTSMKAEDMREPEMIDNKHTIPQLKKLAPSIDWDQYLQTLGLAVKDVNVMQPAFIRESETLLTELAAEEWQTYFDWHLINAFAGLLSPAFGKERFAFNGTVIMGQQKMRPLPRRVMQMVNGSLSEALGQVYVSRFFSAESKAKVNAMVDDFFVAYEARIKALDWMSATTKKKALQKLAALNRKLAYPDTWKSYKGLVIRADDYVGNVMRSAEYEHKRMLKKLGKPIDRKEWYCAPQIVNAFYSPNHNDMLFPAGILQPPFFNPNADDAVNYGAIGLFIGHEMSHAFDNMGAKFDLKGNLKDWWTPEDAKLFAAKGTVVKKQFDEYVVEGLHVNGKMTLGENIADLAGLHVAYDAYQLKLARTERRDIDGFTPEHRFFLGFAGAMLEISRPEFMRLRILTDAHAPPCTRINGPLSNMPEFYEAFGVKKGDALYRAPAKRAKIW